MNTKHTPGPWKLDDDLESVIDDNGEPIAMWATDCGDKIRPENLKLIAAAPELLEFLIDHYRFLNLGDQKKAEILIKKATE